MTPDISYIVSCYNRPDMLPVIGNALKVQTHKNFEVIITDNATDKAIAAKHKAIVAQLNKDDGRFHYLKTKGPDCYWSAEQGMKIASGSYLCFPCDDTYYVPHFGQKMISAAVSNQWDFVTVGKALMGPDTAGYDFYCVWNMGRLAFPTGKIEFIVRADKFPGFPCKGKTAYSVNCDRILGQQIMFGNSGLTWGIVDECLVVHN